MSRIRSKDTSPEIMLRKALHAYGYRFRKNVKKLPGTPDIVLPKYRSVIFVNGCFWHGHVGCGKYTVPKSNVKFWQEKIRRNIERDIESSARLEILGWAVITVWECELTKKSIDATVLSVSKRFRTNQEAWVKHEMERKKDRALRQKENKERRKVLDDLEKELSCVYHIPSTIKRMAKQTEDVVWNYDSSDCMNLDIIE